VLVVDGGSRDRTADIMEGLDGEEGTAGGSQMLMRRASSLT